MKNVFLTACWVLGCFLPSPGQEQPDKLQRADALFERFEYYKSAAIYLELADKKSPSRHVLERLAGCYLRMNDFAEAEKWQEKLSNGPNGTNYALGYGEILLMNQQFDKAKEQFRKYYGKNTRELDIKLAQCDSAASWMQEAQPRYRVRNVEAINSKWSDWGAVYYKDSIVFVSDRVKPETKETVRYPWTNNAFLKLYKTSNGESGAAGLFDPGTGAGWSKDLHYGPVAFSSSGDTCYLTVTTSLPQKALLTGWSELSDNKLYTRRLELFTGVRKNGRWTGFTRFQYDDVNAWSIGHATLSQDGNTLYFTSDRPGGQGKTDIWYCVKQSNGSWGKPVNCGKNINTKEEEAFPSSGNGKLFFASKGLQGMGGYDIFESSGSRSAWSAPVNLKYPVNSTYDDFSLVTRDGDSGYFSSNRPGGSGNDDLYTFTGATYHTGPVTNPPVADSTVEPTAPAPVLIPGATFVLENIYYDLDKWNIRPDAAAGLDKLAAILRENPSMKIGLSSHTDSRAPDDYNLALSRRRAEAAVKYLVQQGIAADRLTAKGYGETRLVNSCSNGILCTEEQHQLNRRTEIKVLSN